MTCVKGAHAAAAFSSIPASLTPRTPTKTIISTPFSPAAPSLNWSISAIASLLETAAKRSSDVERSEGYLEFSGGLEEPVAELVAVAVVVL